MKRRAEMVLREAPDAIRSAKMDALIVDQVSLEGGTVAESVGIPHVSVANALPLNTEPGVPPISSHRGYRDTTAARLRNRAAYFVQDRAFEAQRRAVQDGRRAAGLPPFSGRDPWFSNLVQDGQIPVEFDFPRREIPDWFHYTGPFHACEARAPVPFPYERLDGRPLIYASMGTLQNRLLYVFQAIAAACVGLDAQLVISLGGSAAPESLPPLAGPPIVVGYAPPLELVAKARLVITHAGLNTTMETLGQGVPMVAIPVANDQPGVASRLAHAGAGLMVPLRGLRHERLRRAIERVLAEPNFAENAKRLQGAIRRAGGADRASRVIETGAHFRPSRPRRSINDRPGSPARPERGRFPGLRSAPLVDRPGGTIHESAAHPPPRTVLAVCGVGIARLGRVEDDRPVRPWLS